MKIHKIPNQVVQGKLTPLKISNVDSIVLHHMAHSAASVKEVERWHINNGWAAIGYNYWVGFDGCVYQGRGLNIGAAVAKHNSHIVSIGFQGDYSKTVTMPDTQFNAGVEVIRYVMNMIPNTKVVGHRDFGGSACPGKFFPFDEMKALIKREEEDKMIYNYVDDNMPDWARETITKLVNKGYIKGNEKGELGLNDTMLKILVINDRAGLY